MSKDDNKDQGHNQRQQAEKRRESGGSYQGGENSRQPVPPGRRPEAHHAEVTA